MNLLSEGRALSRAHRVAIAAAAGLVAGTVVLGVGGRLLMRAVAYTDPAPARFTWLGTLGVLGAGAAWGTVTGPVLLLFDMLRAGWQWARGIVFGTVVLGLAALAVGSIVGFGGPILAPPAFIILSAVAFPLLFLAHGVLVDVLVRRWLRPKPPARSSPAAV
ncbi:MAG: hypothetical protein ACYTA3_09445 [Planctomycetota bacterium]|jgi:hypothetical protein